MFRRFHNAWQEYRRVCGKAGARLSSRRGQVAIVLIFIIAIGLIYYAIVFNLGKVSDSKTTATIAANTAAAQMGSLMASYGEQLFQEVLGGRKKYCKGTSVIISIIAVILAVIILIFAPYLAPLIGVGLTFFTAVAVIGLVMAITALALNVTVIQPGITKMWNKMMSGIRAPRHQFVERGIQTAIVAAVTDPVQVPDLTDFDNDGVFEPDPQATSPADEVSRFAIYYTERLRAVQSPNSAAIEDFLEEVEALLYGGADPLVDPVNCPSAHPCCNDYSSRPSICNPCCNPSSEERPEDCGDPTMMCVNNSPYRGGDEDYPWIYRPIIQDESNGIHSVVERIGEDDPHPVYNRDPDNTHWNAQQIWQPPGVPGNYYFNPDPPLTPTLPRIEDTAGFYKPGDQRVTGIFATFYKLRDWGTALADLNYLNEECHWTDLRTGIICDNPVLPARLFLPNDGTVPPYSYAGENLVDNANTTSGPTGPQLLDRVPLPEIFLAEGECGLIGSLADPGKGWKSGSDRYCSHQAPYDAGCEKHGGVEQCFEPDGEGGFFPTDCDCGETGAGPATLWRDDDLDAIVRQMEEAAVFFQFFLDQNVQELAWTFEDWYDAVAEWIEPGCDDPPDTCPSYTKELRGGPAQGGIMWQWLDILQAYINKVNAWLNGPYVGEGCRNDEGEAIWCVPPASGGECPGVTAEEAATFGAGPSRGNLNSVIACLDWNANDTLDWTSWSGGASTPQTATGNAEKFYACLTQCNELAAGEPEADPSESCGNLPRSLLGDLPNYYAGFCDDHYDAVLNSAMAADNQVAKLRKRHEFLRDRRNELVGMRDMMQTALNKIAGFICGPPNGGDPAWYCGPGQGQFDLNNPNSPVEHFINARINWQEVVPKTESVVIYAWQDEKRDKPRNRPMGLDPYEGYWHAVKVEVRLPERCNAACAGGDDAGGREPGFPKVKTYSKGFLKSKRCFELVNTLGRVKVRVIRYDEDHDPSNMSFPGGRKIWDMYNSHPDAPGVTGGSPGPGGLMRDDACGPFVLPQFKDIPYVENAFMLNEPPRSGQEPLRTCWREVHQKMLEYGHSTESCVEFFFGGGGFGDPGMRMKFVPCDRDFLRGTK